jgi:peptidoglycan-N-acetylglucosamine deacetylase
MAVCVAVLAWSGRFAQFVATAVRILVRRLRYWTYRDGVLTSGALRTVATGGFVVILAIAVLGSLLPSPPLTPVASPTVGSSASPSASPSAKPSASPSVKPVSTKPAKGTVMTTTGSKAVALTFDDGPWPGWTVRILDQLKAAGVKATFCLIGRQVAANAAVVRRMVAEGHTLCNHTWAHDLKLGQKTPDQIKADVDRTDAAIHAAVPGVPIRYFRQPGGTWTAAEIKVLAAMGKRPLGWTVDPSDWEDPGSSVIASRVVSHTRTGSIVLLHDGGGNRSQTSTALKRILPALKAKYKLIALPAPAS